MDRLAVDANVLFGALISGRDEYLTLFADYQLFLPDFALHEIQIYQEIILRKTKLAPEKLQAFTLNLFDQVTVVPNFLISTQSYLRAFELCKRVDEKDTPYLALSMEFDIHLLSKDEELVNGLRGQGYEKVITLKEFFDQIG